MSKIPNILHFKITLIGLQPEIWRSIAIPSDVSFFELHVAIQDAFGWTNSHLHQFFTKSPFTQNSRYQIISLPMPEMDESLDEDEEQLGDWFKKRNDRLFYEYDFGDSWMHEVKLEEIAAPTKNKKYPALLGGERACPPDDCGGIGGYADLLDALADPKNPERENYLEWLDMEDPSLFDPALFNAKKVKFRRLPKQRKVWMKR